MVDLRKKKIVRFRIAYIGDVDKDTLYQQAQEYFKDKNSQDENFEVIFEDISDMSSEQIEANTYHMVVFDRNILDSDDKVDVLKNLKNSKNDISDLNFFPYAREEITKEQIEATSEELKEKLGLDSNFRTIPVNISDSRDVQGFLDAMYISGSQYRDVADEVVKEAEGIRGLLDSLILEALREKDEIAGKQYVTYDHVTSVGKMTERFARFMGFDEEKVESMKHVAIEHDTGKIVIPSDILHAGITLGNEVAQMNPHDELGSNILRKNDVLNQDERLGVSGHHGKAHEDNDYSNIITLIDSFDAMTSQRGYNSPKNIIDALEDVMKSSSPNIRGFTQFRDKNVSEKFILYNIIELGKMGYDVRAMFESILQEKEANNQKAQESNNKDRKFAAKASLDAVHEIIDLCEKYKSEIVIENPPTQEVSSLGYTLDENGRLNYVDKTLKHDSNIRLNSEFEFQVKNYFFKDRDNNANYSKYQNDLKNIKDINELIEFYLKVEGVSSKEESSLWAKANSISKASDERGQKLVNIGREASKENQEVINEQEDRKIALGPQVREAAKEDEEFNKTNMVFINRAIIESLLVHNQEKNNENNGLEK